MPAENRPAPFLIADDPALDFLNSRCAPWGTEIEWLSNGADLADWLGAAGLSAGQDVPAPGDDLAGVARALREWFRHLMLRHAETGFTAVTDTELAPINAILERNGLSRRLLTGDTRPVLQTRHRRDAPEAALYPLADAIAGLIAQGEVTRIRCCENPECGLWFKDVSRANRRRWCSMAVCGNRAKVAGFRARQRPS